MHWSLFLFIPLLKLKIFQNVFDIPHTTKLWHHFYFLGQCQIWIFSKISVTKVASYNSELQCNIQVVRIISILAKYVWTLSFYRKLCLMGSSQLFLKGPHLSNKIKWPLMNKEWINAIVMDWHPSKLIHCCKVVYWLQIHLIILHVGLCFHDLFTFSYNCQIQMPQTSSFCHLRRSPLTMYCNAIHMEP